MKLYPYTINAKIDIHENAYESFLSIMTFCVDEKLWWHETFFSIDDMVSDSITLPSVRSMQKKQCISNQNKEKWLSANLKESISV